jgi:hypothetical protein
MFTFAIGLEETKLNQKIAQMNTPILVRQGQQEDENTFLYAFEGQAGRRLPEKEGMPFSILAFCTSHTTG